jgi:hypothetical protein
MVPRALQTEFRGEQPEHDIQPAFRCRETPKLSAAGQDKRMETEKRKKTTDCTDKHGQKN